MYKTCKLCGVKRDLAIATYCPVCKYGRPEIVIDKLTVKRKFNYKDYAKRFKLFKKPEEYMMQFRMSQLKGRKLDIMIVKRVIVRTLRDHYKLSFPKIAKLMKYKDHTTCVHIYYKENSYIG